MTLYKIMLNPTPVVALNFKILWAKQNKQTKKRKKNSTEQNNCSRTKLTLKTNLNIYVQHAPSAFWIRSSCRKRSDEVFCWQHMPCVKKWTWEFLDPALPAPDIHGTSCSQMLLKVTRFLHANTSSIFSNRLSTWVLVKTIWSNY